MLTVHEAIKLTPGGAGVIELMLSVLGGDEAAVVAAVFIFRFLIYAFTLPVGAASYVFWLRNTSWRSTAPLPPHWLTDRAVAAGT